MRALLILVTGWPLSLKLRATTTLPILNPIRAPRQVLAASFAMCLLWARVRSLLNALRFGQSDHEKTKHLVSGVTAGIGGYGNCIGIPTVGGEVNFHKSYNGNILVNAMAVGLAHADRIFYSAATGAGNPVIYVGAKTGVTAFMGQPWPLLNFLMRQRSKRPTVQVGDPFTGKLLMEACLELMAADAVLSIQDMGAAGLTSSSVEMASKGGLGMEIDLDLVPVRETGMTAYEIMLSESQGTYADGH